MNEHLDRYMEGWLKGDLAMIVSACAEDFVMDDPGYGRFTKAEFGAYYEMQPEAVFECGEMVTEEIGGQTTQWGSWKLAPYEGAFMNKAGPDGVHFTKVTYYVPNPEIPPRK